MDQKILSQKLAAGFTALATGLGDRGHSFSTPPPAIPLTAGHERAPGAVEPAPEGDRKSFAGWIGFPSRRASHGHGQWSGDVSGYPASAWATAAPMTGMTGVMGFQANPHAHARSRLTALARTRVTRVTAAAGCERRENRVLSRLDVKRALF